MYIRFEVLKQSIESLRNVHSFFGISFLAFKQNHLPVGTSVDFNIGSYEKEILTQYYRPEISSSFFTPFKSTGKEKYWINNDYPGSTAQKFRTTLFKDAFIHEDKKSWGWQKEYIPVLQDLIKHYQGTQTPILPLAFWVLRNHEWEEDADENTVLKVFMEKFNLTSEEIESLFERKTLSQAFSLQSTTISWTDLREALSIPPPPDAPNILGGALSYIEFNNVGAFHHIEASFSERINIFTGDNGLGKTLLLETAWWALSQHWTSQQAFPITDNGASKPSIRFSISPAGGKPESIFAKYDNASFEWEMSPKRRLTDAGLVLYSRIDGLVGIYDSTRISNQSLIFSREELWNGYSIRNVNKQSFLCNGLIQDWIYWQTSQEDNFKIFKEILRKLSPPGIENGDLGVMEPGKPTRLPNESRLIPTIRHSYGEVPILFTSAAVQRILSLAYLIYWAWDEHKTQASLRKAKPHQQIVILIDEVEAHLHPKWQRLVLPAIMEVVQMLSSELQVQLLITTHAPLVLASIEPIFDLNKDRLFHFDLQQGKNSNEIVLNEIDFERRGSVNSWLQSDVFEMLQPSSMEAEIAVQEAKKLLESDSGDIAQWELSHKKLVASLPPHDTFWIRWNYKAGQHGVLI